MFDKILNWLLVAVIIFMSFWAWSISAESTNSVQVTVWELERAFDLCKNYGTLEGIVVFFDSQENLAVCKDGTMFGMDIPLNEIKPL